MAFINAVKGKRPQKRPATTKSGLTPKIFQRPQPKPAPKPTPKPWFAPRPAAKPVARPAQVQRTAARPVPVQRPAARPVQAPPKQKGILPSLFGPSRPTPVAPVRTRPAPPSPAAAIVTAAQIMNSPYEDPSAAAAVDQYLNDGTYGLGEADPNYNPETEGDGTYGTGEPDPNWNPDLIDNGTYGENEEDESSMGFELPGSALIKAKTGSGYAAPLLYVAVGGVLLYWASRMRPIRTRRYA